MATASPKTALGLVKLLIASSAGFRHGLRAGVLAAQLLLTPEEAATLDLDGVAAAGAASGNPFTQLVRGLVELGEWRAISMALQQRPPTLPFETTRLAAALLSRRWPQNDSDPDRIRVWSVLFPTVASEAAALNASMAGTAARAETVLHRRLLLHAKQAEMLRRLGSHDPRLHDAIANPVGLEDNTFDTKLAQLVQLLHPAVIGKLGVQSVRWLASEYDGRGVLALRELLLRRPDLDPNTRMPDGAPAWYTRGTISNLLRQMAQLLGHDPRPVMRIDLDLPLADFSLDDVPVSMLSYSLEVQRQRAVARRRRGGDGEWGDDEEDEDEDDDAFESEAWIVHLVALGAAPISETEARTLHADTAVRLLLDWGGDTSPHRDDDPVQLNAKAIADAGLLLRPQDMAILRRGLGADHPALPRIAAAFAGHERWQRREAVLRALALTTQRPAAGLHPQAEFVVAAGRDDEQPAATRRHVDPAAQEQELLPRLMAAMFSRDVNQPVEADLSLRVASEYGGLVAGFLGGRRAHRRR